MTMVFAPLFRTQSGGAVTDASKAFMLNIKGIKVRRL
jgi:hypothetical protein